MTEEEEIKQAKNKVFEYLSNRDIDLIILFLEYENYKISNNKNIYKDDEYYKHFDEKAHKNIISIHKIEIKRIQEEIKLFQEWKNNNLQI